MDPRDASASKKLTSASSHENKLSNRDRVEVAQQICDDSFDNISATKSISSCRIIRISPSNVDIAGAVGHENLVAVVKTRVLLFVATPDVPFQVFTFVLSHCT